MKIYICDDDTLWLETCKAILEQYAVDNGVECTIHNFADGKELLKAEPCDILFLDIELNTENGISIASRLNQEWTDCQVVYVTDYIAYATEVYHTNHAFYMLKDQFEQRIDEIFDKVFHEQAQKKHKLNFNLIGGTVLSIYPCDLLYFERFRRTTRIITVHGRFETSESLISIEKRLPSLDFGRCHNSYIVYFPAVFMKRKDGFKISNGDEVVISRHYQNNMKTAFLRWIKTQL